MNNIQRKVLLKRNDNRSLQPALIGINHYTYILTYKVEDAGKINDEVESELFLNGCRKNPKSP